MALALPLARSAVGVRRECGQRLWVSLRKSCGVKGSGCFQQSVGSGRLLRALLARLAGGANRIDLNERIRSSVAF